MPRAMWSGSIAFGLVSIPVRMYAAVAEHALRFHLVHEPDGGPIGYEKICKVEERPVPESEIVKAYELDGKLVYLDEEDFAAAEAERYRSIDIQVFVGQEEIDPIFFERAYYLGPEDGSEHVYALFARALDESGLVAVARFVMREREHLGCLRVRDGAIVLSRLYFADELRPAADVRPGKVRVGNEELAMARELIERFRGRFEPERYEDDYRARLLAIIEGKARGKQAPRAPAKLPEAPPDLLEALRASVRAAGERQVPRASRAQRRSGGRRRAGTRR